MQIKLTNKNINLFSLAFKAAIILFLMSCFITACTRRLYNDKLSEKDLDTGSVYLTEYFNWAPLKSRKYFTEFIYESTEPNLFNLYKKHDFNMLWIDRGNLNDNAKQLITSLRASWKEGLSNEEYNISQIYEYISDLQGKKKINPRTMEKYIRLDLLFSLAYLDYASDLLSGRVNPNALDSVWEAHPREYELLEIMEIALETGTVTHSLNELKPKNPQYSKLSARLKDYLIIRDNGGWKQPGYFSLLTIGDSNPNLIPVKNYLRTTGDLEFVDSAYMNSEIFDEKLEEAVINFQLRHGLKIDGMIGKTTLREMNKPVEYRIDQIKVNLERLRWLPEKFGEKYILINLPEFRLRYYEKDYLVEEMKIMIGEIENYTPVLKDTLKYIVFNPNWNLPQSIVMEEILPKVKSDSTYLERSDYILLKGSYNSKDTINPDSVDWSEIDKENFPYYVVQTSGKHNALGKVKFLFPNHHAIYLHDTPSRHLFELNERAFSHGCIRLEKPFELARKILYKQMSWLEIQEILKSEETTTITLNETVNVHFLYRTAWVDEYNRIHFRKDLYNFDRMTAEKL